MFKIDKKVVSIITGIVLVSSINLSGCSSDNSKDEGTEEKKVYVTPDDSRYTAVYYNGSSAIIIPFSSSTSNRNGITDLYVDSLKSSVRFSTSDLTIFHEENDMTSYEQAYNFASALSNEVYLYSDVMNGNLVNLVIEDKIDRELGISK